MITVWGWSVASDVIKINDHSIMITVWGGGGGGGQWCWTLAIIGSIYASLLQN